MVDVTYIMDASMKLINVEPNSKQLSSQKNRKHVINTQNDN